MSGSAVRTRTPKCPSVLALWPSGRHLPEWGALGRPGFGQAEVAPGGRSAWVRRSSSLAGRPVGLRPGPSPSAVPGVVDVSSWRRVWPGPRSAADADRTRCRESWPRPTRTMACVVGAGGRRAPLAVVEPTSDIEVGGYATWRHQPTVFVNPRQAEDRRTRRREAFTKIAGCRHQLDPGVLVSIVAPGYVRHHGRGALMATWV